ncbi:MAG: hypothetical protein A3G39_00310 [Deltaproteobacteria bacterium RIFCSPLOWO2_12_FULL_43_16]|nr:MAG: hypothetical protein A2Z89_08915 [Deltaproteobacteria bacterium GWA2_43_19]OGQ13097.1 MAG: hypothetical protein A3D30_09800 [Deltaproteobacteria bacterium RIFCSPHIGHO2_02_FULL_43_33]OGQ61808.1 MAG: hypothetical protein A3G39_00310 [Deltaproteobacteria bacterium RIFCSPLOWO2_12_FULL_43_16]HBR16991.1 hypothetical protein [Deltaproteobacteria bacterium]
MFMDIMPEINDDVTCVPLADYWANHFKSFLFNGICPCFPLEKKKGSGLVEKKKEKRKKERKKRKKEKKKGSGLELSFFVLPRLNKLKSPFQFHAHL